MSGDLGDLAVQIYEKAIESDLTDRGLIKRDDNTWVDGGGMLDDDTVQYLVDDAVQAFADVPGLFADFSVMPQEGDFNDSISQVESAMHVLCSGQEGASDPMTGQLFGFNVVLKDMTTAAGYLQTWDGLAMMEFSENFAAPFPERVLNQFAAAAVLANALRAEQALWKAANEDVLKIANDVLAALDHMHDCSGNDWKMAFSVVGAVIAVGAATVASGGTAAIALAMAGAAVGVASDVAGEIEEPPEAPYSGETAREVIDALRSALKDLKTYITNAEDKVKNACSTANATLQGDGGRNYVADKPMLLDQDRPDVGQPDND